MVTTAFDQTGDWSEDPFLAVSKIDSPGLFTTNPGRMFNANFEVEDPIRKYPTYITPQYAEREQIEVFDEEPRRFPWDYYFDFYGRAERLKDDPAEERAFLRLENIDQGIKKSKTPVTESPQE